VAATQAPPIAYASKTAVSGKRGNAKPQIGRSLADAAARCVHVRAAQPPYPPLGGYLGACACRALAFRLPKTAPKADAVAAAWPRFGGAGAGVALPQKAPPLRRLAVAPMLRHSIAAPGTCRFGVSLLAAPAQLRVMPATATIATH
jgi:hypothetical protein